MTSQLHQSHQLRAGTYPQYKKGGWQSIQDVAAVEERVTLRITGQPDVLLWAHPTELESLALGHAKLELCAEGQSPVLLGQEGLTFALELRDEAAGGHKPPPAWTLNGDTVLEAMETLFAEGGLWAQTGCFHRAGLYDLAKGAFVALAQDIGRHNCLDRLAGKALQQNLNLAACALFVSARCTASLARKVCGLGVPLVVSRSAVTTGALEQAAAQGLSVAGFCREGRVTVFTDPAGRISHG